jgi:hypothetical protein
MATTSMKIDVTFSGAVALFLYALAAQTEHVQAGELHRGRCHMEQCSWFSIEEKDLVGTSVHGALFKVRSRDWQSSHPNGSYDRQSRRSGGDESTNYVLCSKRKPAVIFPNSNEATSELIRLAPGNLDAIAGATEYVNMYYFAVCHGLIPKNEQDIERLGKRFGYSISADVAEIQETGRPDDLLKP